MSHNTPPGGDDRILQQWDNVQDGVERIFMPHPVYPGQTVTVGANLRARGELEGTDNVTALLRVNGTTVDERTVNVDAFGETLRPRARVTVPDEPVEITAVLLSPSGRVDEKTVMVTPEGVASSSSSGSSTTGGAARSGSMGVRGRAPLGVPWWAWAAGGLAAAGGAALVLRGDA